jgi:hypothetical protein
LQTLLKQDVHPFQIAFAQLAFADKGNHLVMISQCLG